MKPAKLEQEREVDLSWWLGRHGFVERDLSQTIARQTTALMHAARYGASEIARKLLSFGAPINARNADGNNALWFACFSRSLVIIDMLVAAGVDLDNQNDEGVTCLMYAASAGFADVVERLLAHNADPSLRSRDDFDALGVASNVTCLRLLDQRARRLAGRGAASDARDAKPGADWH